MANKDDLAAWRVAVQQIPERLREASAEFLEDFIHTAIQTEREACAKAAESEGVYPELNVFGGGPDWYKHGKRIAEVIRARGNPAPVESDESYQASEALLAARNKGVA